MVINNGLIALNPLFITIYALNNHLYHILFYTVINDSYYKLRV